MSENREGNTDKVVYIRPELDPEVEEALNPTGSDAVSIDEINDKAAHKLMGELADVMESNQNSKGDKQNG